MIDTPRVAAVLARIESGPASAADLHTLLYSHDLALSSPAFAAMMEALADQGRIEAWDRDDVVDDAIVTSRWYRRPAPPAAVLDLAAAHLREESPTRLLATVEILGVKHFLGLVRVVMVAIDKLSRRMAGDPVAAEDDPGFDHFEQRAYDPEDDAELDDVFRLYESTAVFATVTVPGRDGDWVAYLHPYGE
jgi:hypothetical protein